MKILALTLSMLIAAPGAALSADCKPATDAQIDEIRSAMDVTLLDAQSARFKDVCMQAPRRETTNKVAFCGKVNAKNKLGAYVGYRAFSYIEGAEPTFLTMADTSEGDRARFFYCIGCLGSADYCLKQKWIHNPKLLR